MNNDSKTLPTNLSTNAYFSKKKKSNPLETFMTTSVNTKRYKSFTNIRPKNKSDHSPKINKKLFVSQNFNNFEIKLVESDFLLKDEKNAMTKSIDIKNFIHNNYNKNKKNMRYSNYTLNSSIANFSRNELVTHCENLEKLNKKLKNENTYFKEIIEIYQNGIHKKTKIDLVNLKKEHKLIKKKFLHLEKNFTKYLFDLKLKLENKNRHNLEDSKRDLVISYATDQNKSIQILKKEIKKLKKENIKLKLNPKKMLKKKYKEILEEKDNEISFLKKIVNIRQSI